MALEPISLVAGLFRACVENFDIIVSAKSFSADFDLLCTELDLQRLRLGLWGETLGLVPNPDGLQIPYNKALDRTDIKPVVEKALDHLRLLLERADVVTARYELEGNDASHVPTSSGGLVIFKERFESFKQRLRQIQKPKSTWKLTTWAVHDFEKFKLLITNIKSLIDGLESLTGPLGVLSRQQALLEEQIESISDTRSLRLLQDIASSHSASRSDRLVSDAASQRLSLISDTRSTSQRTGKTSTYYTAPSQLESRALTMISENYTITRSADDDDLDWSGQASHLYKPKYLQQSTPLDRQGPNNFGEDRRKQFFQDVASSSADIPQHRRVMNDLIRKASGNASVSSFTFDSGDFGMNIKAIKEQDDNIWIRSSASLISQAHQNISTARRVFLELRSIREAAVPFFSASPVGDSLDKILACIEGPPETPYHGGVFWISVKFPEEGSPPLLRFQTKIYHPNIDYNGKICADFQSWWNNPQIAKHITAYSNSSNKPWFSTSRSNNFSLGILLTALCGLLAAPNLEDPLVPEIAEIYIMDYCRFCQYARQYTKKYANAGRPEDNEIVFDDDQKKEEILKSRLLASLASNYQDKAKSSIFPSDVLSSHSFENFEDCLAIIEDTSRGERRIVFSIPDQPTSSKQITIPVRIRLPWEALDQTSAFFLQVSVDGNEFRALTQEWRFLLDAVDSVQLPGYRLCKTHQDGKIHVLFEAEFELVRESKNFDRIAVSIIGRTRSRWATRDGDIQIDLSGSIDEPASTGPREFRIPITTTKQSEYKGFVTVLFNIGSQTLIDQPADLDEFERDHIIGKGDFGIVYKTRRKSTGRLYALKVISKDSLISQGDLPFSNQRQHRWKLRFRPTIAKSFFAPVKYIFQTSSNYYLLRDYIIRGPLLQYRSSYFPLDGFSRELANFYTCELVLALEMLIKQSIHWDLKPDNIMLDCTGHLVIGDFGISKLFPDQVTELTPPETIKTGMYSDAGYYWILGCLIYNLIEGKSLFYDEDEWVMRQNICKGGENIVKPHDIGRRGHKHRYLDRSLVRLLLVLDPENRMGCQGGMDEVKQHSQFSNVDWKSVENRSVPVPSTFPGPAHQELPIITQKETPVEKDEVAPLSTDFEDKAYSSHYLDYFAQTGWENAMENASFGSLPDWVLNRTLYRMDRAHKEIYLQNLE